MIRSFLTVLVTLLALGCGDTSSGTGMSRTPFPAPADVPVTSDRPVLEDRPTPPPPASCGTRPMEYEFAIRPNSYAGTTRELVLTIPNVRSPIVGGEFRTFYEVSGNWFLYGINQFFDYRSSGGSDQVDYLDCRNRLMMAKTLRINVQVPTNGTRVAMFAIFHSINRSNLVIGGLAGTSDMAPPCALDLELLCDGAACSRSLVNFTSGITRVCGLPLN